MNEEDLKRVKCKLSAKVLYSKHFGWGFYDDGSKVRPSLLSCQVSPEKRELFEFLRLLPPTETQFLDQYPHFDNLDVDSRGRSLNAFDLLWRGDSVTPSIASRVDSYFADTFGKSLSDFALESLSTPERQVFYTLLKYHPQLIRSLCARCRCAQDWSPDLLPVTPFDDRYTTSVVYYTLRKYITQSISRKLGFFAFPYNFKDTVRYCGLSKYYRRYLCTADDYIALYNSVGITDFDDYCQYFESRVSDSELVVQRSNYKNTRTVLPLTL